jgi:hypothetical protein
MPFKNKGMALGVMGIPRIKHIIHIILVIADGVIESSVPPIGPRWVGYNIIIPNKAVGVHHIKGEVIVLREISHNGRYAVIENPRMIK